MRTLLILTCCLFLVSPLKAAGGNNEPGIVIVKVTSKELLTNINEMTVNNFRTFALGDILNRFGVRKIEKVFLESTPADTFGHDLQGRQVRLIDLSGWLRLTFDPQTNLEEVIKQLHKVDCVLKAHRDGISENADVFPVEIDTPAEQQAQWGLYNSNARILGLVRDINAPAAWEFQKGKQDVTIAVIDGSGLDHTHLDLDPGDRSRIIIGRNTGSNTDNTLPGGDPHGTRIAGVIGAITNNGDVYGQNSIAGVMWNCKLLPVKNVTDASGSAAAINWAKDHALILNCSWLNRINEQNADVLHDAIGNAYLMGRIISASMGNDANNDNYTYYPAAAFGVIGVGGTTEDDQRWFRSNTGAHISVVAPAVNYRTTTLGHTYGNFEGTSLSAPLVSGAAGLILSQSLDRGLNLTNDDVKHLLEKAADHPVLPPGQWDQFYGWGRINIGRAIKQLTLPRTVEKGLLGGGTVQLLDDPYQMAMLPDYYGSLSSVQG